MQRKLSVRIIASLILSVMLFALPVGAFIANSSTAVSVYAEESVTGNEAGTTDDSSSSADASDSESTDNGSSEDGTDTSVENPTGGDNSDAGDGSNTGDSTSENESGDGETGEDDPTPTPEPTPEPEPECICEHKCSQYDYNKDCPVCSQNFKDCEYKEPSVKITINTPSGWYSSGTSAKVTFFPSGTPSTVRALPKLFRGLLLLARPIMKPQTNNSTSPTISIPESIFRSP